VKTQKLFCQLADVCRFEIQKYCNYLVLNEKKKSPNFSTEPDQAFMMGQDAMIPATEAEETLIEEVGGQVLDTTAAKEQEGRGQHKKMKNRLYFQENLRWWDRSH
jgi:hypothetical protein